MKRLALALILFAAPLAAQDYHQTRPKPKEGFSYPDCFCTNRGDRVELGQTACLRVDGRAFTALCAMSLNQPRMAARARRLRPRRPQPGSAASQRSTRARLTPMSL